MCVCIYIYIYIFKEFSNGDYNRNLESRASAFKVKALTRKTDLEYSANSRKQGKLIPKSQENFKTESKQQQKTEREREREREREERT